MERNFARIISAVFSPLLIPTIAFAILYSLKAYFTLMLPFQSKMLILGIVSINTLIFPLLLIILLYKTGIITSYNLEKREERTYPLIAAAVLYYITYFLLNRLNIPSVYLLFMLGGALSAVTALIVTNYYKISVHMMAIGGLAGTLAGISIRLKLDIHWIIAVVIVFAGLTGTARLVLRVHQPHQVYTGFAAGAGIMLLIFLLL